MLKEFFFSFIVTKINMINIFKYFLHPVTLSKKLNMTSNQAILDLDEW